MMMHPRSDNAVVEGENRRFTECSMAFGKNLPLRGKGGVGVLLGVALVAATILSHQRYSVRRACFPLHKEVHDGSFDICHPGCCLQKTGFFSSHTHPQAGDMILNFRRQAARHAPACTHLDTF